MGKGVAVLHGCRSIPWLAAGWLVAGVISAAPYGSIAHAAEGGAEKPEVAPGRATQWKVSGYMQGRLSHEEGEPWEFLVRRARLKVEARFQQEASFLLQLAADKHKVSLKDAVVKYHFPSGLTLEVGQRKWNASYEVLQSSSVREMPERSAVARYLFPGERDRGVMLSGRTRGRQPLYWAVGLWNGNGIKDQDGELNDFKDVVVYFTNLRKGKGPYQGPPQLKWQLYGYWGRARQLFVDAAGNVTGGGNRPKWRAGFGLQYHYVSVPEDNPYIWREGSALKIEVITGKGYATDPSHQGRTWRDASAWGFWAQWMRNILPTDDLVIRYDLFDPQGGDYERTLGLGWIHYLGAVTCCTFAYAFASRPGQDKGRFTLQLQFKY